MGENLVSNLPYGTKYEMESGWSINRNKKGDVGIFYKGKVVMGLCSQFVEDAMISFHTVQRRGIELRMMGQPIIKLPNPTLIGWRIDT